MEAYARTNTFQSISNEKELPSSRRMLEGKRFIGIAMMLRKISFIFLGCLYLSAVYADSHKQKMIDFVNEGEYTQAAEELPLVAEWTFDWDEQDIHLNLDSGLKFMGLMDTTRIPKSTNDSLSLYLAKVSYRIGLNYYKQKFYDKTLSCWELTARLRLTILGEKHSGYANALNNLGMVYAATRNYSKAESYFLKALEIRRSVSGEKHPKYADGLHNLGALYKDMGDYSKAEACYLQALEITKSVYGEQPSKYANALYNLGYIYTIIGKYSKAEVYFLLALEITKSVYGEQHSKYANALNSLGVAYNDMGDYSKAEACYLQALEITKSVYGEQHIDCAYALNNLGILYDSMGDYAKAEACLLQALEIRKSVLGEQHPKYALALHNLGMVYAGRGKKSKAAFYYRKALEVYNSVYGENNPHSASSLHNLGLLYNRIGKYSKAEPYLLQALEITKSVYGEQHPKYANTLNALGIVYNGMGDYSKAEAYYLQALEITKSVLGDQHQDCILMLKNIGSLYTETGDYSKTQTYYLQASQLQKNEFLTSLDFMTEQQRQHYWRTMQKAFTRTYPYFSYLSHIQIPSVSTFAYDNELFTKGLLLNSSNAITRSIQESNDTALINAFDKLKSTRQMILNLQEKDPQSPHIAEYTERAEQLEKEITKSSSAYRENQVMWQITWDSVRNHLKKGQVAIEYMIAPLNEDSTMYCALLLRRNSKYPELIPLFEEKEIQSILNINTENNLYDYDSNGQQLSLLIWSKVLPQIKRGETIYFAPSGLLHQLAIEALPYDKKHTMGDVYNMIRLSSTREIALNSSSEKQTTASLYGGIQYTMAADELLAESATYSTMNLLASRGFESDTLNRGFVNYLAGTKAEVENINRMLRDNHLQVQLFTATAANEESFKAISGTHQNILHIATHGFFWPDSTAKKKDFFAQRMMHMDDTPTEKIIDPLSRCGLLFAGANIALQGHSNDLPEGVQDGILTAKEISLLDLREANLVVLSACETGKGEVTGDGVFGLQRAFKMAGVQTIIMSLWPVNDAATQMLMTEFYRNWISLGQPKRAAFRNAQNVVRAQYKEPVYWAGFIMLD